MLHKVLLPASGIDQSISEGLSKWKAAAVLYKELWIVRGQVLVLEQGFTVKPGI